jgi:HK97 family phage portal protein
MAMFKRLFERRSLPDEPWLRDALGGRLTSAGVRVNEKTALTISSVWQCVDILAKNIGTMPLPIYQEVDNGREKARKHSLWRVLNRKANPWMTAATFRMALVVHMALWQAAYAHIERNGYGDVIALWPLLPDRTRPVTKGSSLVFETTLSDGTMRTLPADEVLYIPGLTLNGLEALPTVKMAREVLGLLLAQNEYGARFFSNGANPGGIVTTEMPLTTEQKQQLAQDIADQVKGLSKAHDLLVLSNGAKFTQIGVNPANAQLLESRRFQIEEVGRWFNMPPHKLGLMDKGASYASVEQMQIQFLTETLRPPMILQEQAMNTSLIPEDLWDTYTIEHVAEGLLRGDSKSRAEFYFRMWTMGVFTINDILRKENMNTIGLEGDKHWVPANMMPADQAGSIDAGARAALLSALQGVPSVRALFEQGGGGDGE